MAKEGQKLPLFFIYSHIFYVFVPYRVFGLKIQLMSALQPLIQKTIMVRIEFIH